MYKIDISKGFTKYFTNYSEAKKFALSCGYTTRKIKPVH